MITIIISSILVICYIFLATERHTNVNKAAIAVFAGTVAWMLYISYGTDFVMDYHQADYQTFLAGREASSLLVKDYIWWDVFLPCVGNCAEIVLFLLATMTIVEILHNNGCFDFLSVWLRTRDSRLLMWKLAAFTFIMSANLDNISTTVMMLVVMNSILPRSKDRIVYGSVIVLAANFGGVFTVIGDPITLVLWHKGAITASNYSLAMLVPCFIGWILPTYFISRTLKESVELDSPSLPYRGDDTNLSVWQRLLMFFVGIGGLWFIPTFHNITRLSPFLGAFCVLSVLWVVNEIFNHNIMSPDRRMTRSIPQQLQYSIIQLMLYVMGIMLAVHVADEIGAFEWLLDKVGIYVDNVWILGIFSAFVSMILEGFATGMSLVAMYDVASATGDCATSCYPFMQDGIYWRMISYCTAVGSSVFAFTSLAGIVYLRTEKVGVAWYFRHVGVYVAIAGIVGMAVLWLAA